MKKIFISLFIVTMMLSLVACTESDTGKKDNIQEAIMNPSTDVAVIAKIFPKLEGIETVEFEAKALGNTNSEVPGPTDFQYQGYIVLSDDAATRYATDYKWTDSTNDVIFGTVAVRSGSFKSAPGFVNDIIKKSSYTGRAWMSGNTILFSVYTF